MAHEADLPVADVIQVTIRNQKTSRDLNLSYISGWNWPRIHRLPQRRDSNAAAAHLGIPVLHDVDHPRPGLTVYHGRDNHHRRDGPVAPDQGP